VSLPHDSSFLVQLDRVAYGYVCCASGCPLSSKRSLTRQKSFYVIGCDSGKRYRIRHGTVTNIHEIDAAGRPIMGWCFVPYGELVAGDVMLAQKIALETNEHAALAVANRFTNHGSAQTNSGLVPRRAY
jgi:hypothetical protein